MKRLTAYWSGPFKFTEATRLEIRKSLKDKTDTFLGLIAEACGEYAQEVKANVPRREVNKWRKSIEQIGQHAGSLAKELIRLDPDCARLVDQAYVLTIRRLDAREVVLSRLDELSTACERAIGFRELNPSEGAPADFDRRRLTSECARAYLSVTDKSPSTSPNGTFAHVLLAIEHAVCATSRAQNSISKRYLASVLKPIPN
jgi:hypothetical protein